MTPTLLVGDFILVDTAIYRVGTPSRGDVIVFRYPKNPNIPFVKRVVGIPGDELRYEEKSLYVNGKAVEVGRLGSYSGVGSAESTSGAILIEERLDSASYRILIQPDVGSENSQTVVPPNRYFVLGDNGDNSRDSRYWGFAPTDHLIGRVRIVWMNWDWGYGIDFSRIGWTIQ